MQCVSCSKNIPALAKVCPYCHRDTKESLSVESVTHGMALLGGVVGYMFNGWVGALLGALILGPIAGAIAYWRAQSRSNHAAKVMVVTDTDARSSPPMSQSVVHQEPKGPIPASDPASVHAKRLATLDEMRAKGFVSVDEYNTKRQQILNDI